MEVEYMTNENIWPLSQEHLDEISFRATESMKQDIIEHGEDRLLEIIPMITPAMVWHVLKTVKDLAA
jgi:hypothetical protein